jgi:precorrin-2 dehydrogenase/sirohydrochlorin ferrochelatase
MPGLLVELDLVGRTAVVVGFGAVGRRRASRLLEVGAQVIAIDPAPTSTDDPQVARVRHVREAYRAEHLERPDERAPDLVVAAATWEVNQEVTRDARRLGLWVNSASDPDSGNCSIPAVWRSEGLRVAVSTGGASPSLAMRLRDRIADVLGPSPGQMALLLQEIRPLVLSRIPDPAVRAEFFRRLSDPSWLEDLERDGPVAIRERILNEIHIWINSEA